MAKINIKNLTLEVADGAKIADIANIVNKAVEQISLDASFVNLIKVDLGNAPAESIRLVLDSINDTLSTLGVYNCMIVPLTTRGIQDITIERLEIDRHEENN
ncbi:MAG: hypothetical protein J6A25_01055 [Lachnospiraceae bacterium]|nr:hypothetical protein [Lachnospiraceae bacterium]